MGKHDIQFALDWLSWRLTARNRRYSQEYLDKMAAKKLTEAVTSGYSAPKIAEDAQRSLDAAATNPKPGQADLSCTALCKCILREAREEDFLEMLENNPCKLIEWRKLWNGFRNNRIHRI